MNCFAIELETFSGMSNVHLNKNTRVLSFKRNEHSEVQSIFPYVWLRDNCQCELCFHLQSQARKINCETFDVNAEPSDAKIVDEGLKVVWYDNHESTYNLNWLKERDFAEDVRNKYLVKSYRPEKLIWSKNQFNEIFKTFDFQKILNSDLGEFLCLLIKKSVILLDKKQKV